MLNELLEVFQKKYQEYGDKLILDSYIPKDGTYLLVDYNDWQIKKELEIKFDKKNKEVTNRNDIDFDFIAACDYYSSLLDMNKPMDTKKVIHSNQVYAFFIKKNVIFDKLKKEILEGYKNNILDPYQKYKIKESLEIYESIEKELNPIDKELGNKIFEWVESNIYKLVEKGTKESNYLKIFFISASKENSIENFKNEYKRYTIPNIYNSNIYNEKINNIVYGLPNNNMGMNPKKIYLENKTRKIKVPYLASVQEILLHKSLFDYLLILAKLGKTFVYFNEHEIEGREPLDSPYSGANYLLKISYSKDVEIKSFEIISSDIKKRKINLKLEEIIDLGNISKKEIEYGNLGWKEILDAINNLFFNTLFSKTLAFYNEELDIKDIELKRIVFHYRNAFYRWLYLNDNSQLKEKMNNLLVDSVLFSLKNSYLLKIKHQLNFWLALEKRFNEGSNIMGGIIRVSKVFRENLANKEEWFFKNDAEYAYAIGQFLSFINIKRNSKNKDASFLREVLPIKNNKILKDKLERIFTKYKNYINSRNRKLCETIGNIMEYTPEENMGKVTCYLIAGFCKSIAFYEKEAVNDETNE